MQAYSFITGLFTGGASVLGSADAPVWTTYLLRDSRKIVQKDLRLKDKSSPILHLQRELRKVGPFGGEMLLDCLVDTSTNDWKRGSEGVFVCVRHFQ